MLQSDMFQQINDTQFHVILYALKLNVHLDTLFHCLMEIFLFDFFLLNIVITILIHMSIVDQ